MNKFEPFRKSVGGDRIYYVGATFPSNTYTTGWTFEDVTFRQGALPMVFSNVTFVNVVFDRADLSTAVFIACEFVHCSFKRCDMPYATFIDCVGAEIRFDKCKLMHSMFVYATIDGVVFKECDMESMRLTVKTEFLAPIRVTQCKLQDACIQNLALIQLELPFGIPVLGARDKQSVKIERSTGQYSLLGFDYVTAD